MKVVIVGGVAGGATAAARLRRLSEEVEIVMFEKDEYIAFANCGLPYYIGDVITQREKLLVQTVEGMSKRYNLDIRNFSEVVKIDSEKKLVDVVNHKTGKKYSESYDKLIYTTGASPFVPDFVENDASYFTLRNIPDTDRIYEHIANNDVKDAVVIGGGFIGVEMAENLKERGINTTIVDLSAHILKPFDYEMAAKLEFELKSNGINVLVNTKVSKVTKAGVLLESGELLRSDLTLLAIGVKPNSKLASLANVETTSSGHIIVDSKLRTNQKDIYAIGDVIATNHLVDNSMTNISLASPANRQARLVADTIMGKEINYRGVLGTSVLKVCSLTASSCGLTEEYLKNSSIKYDSIIVTRGSHAGYYPGSTPLTIKLIFEIPTGKILGAQAIGVNGVEKRLDVIATAISANLTVNQLEELELAYAPPFSSAKDPVNIAGYSACNVVNEGIKTFKYDQIKNLVDKKSYLLDVRSSDEFMMYSIDGFINIPLEDLRNSKNKLPKDKSVSIYVTCQVGMRGYLAQKILLHMGFKNVYNLSGGLTVYRQVESNLQHVCKNDSCDNFKANKFELLDARGLQCPGPIKKTYEKVSNMNNNEYLKILVTDSSFCEDINAWANKCGHKLEYTKSIGSGEYEAMIKVSNDNSCEITPNTSDHGTIVMFSGDLDKALATMIIAQGAQAMGKQMTIFFTFWGLNVLRKSENLKTSKTLFEKMFGFMMPKGAKKLPLSKMNMAGIGSKMIKGRMKDKNVESLPEMIEQAQQMGVKFIACKMSMDLMGIKEEELIDNIEYAGVAKYIGESTNADLTLFI